MSLVFFIFTWYASKNVTVSITGSRTSQNLLFIPLMIRASFHGKLSLFMYTIKLSLVIACKT